MVTWGEEDEREVGKELMWEDMGRVKEQNQSGGFRNEGSQALRYTGLI